MPSKPFDAESVPKQSRFIGGSRARALWPLVVGGFLALSISWMRPSSIASAQMVSGDPAVALAARQACEGGAVDECFRLGQMIWLIQGDWLSGANALETRGPTPQTVREYLAIVARAVALHEGQCARGVASSCVAVGHLAGFVYRGFGAPEPQYDRQMDFYLRACERGDIAGCDAAMLKARQVVRGSDLPRAETTVRVVVPRMLRACRSQVRPACVWLDRVGVFEARAGYSGAVLASLPRVACFEGSAHDCIYLLGLAGGSQESINALRELATSSCDQGLGGACYILGVLQLWHSSPPDIERGSRAFARSCELEFGAACSMSALSVIATGSPTTDWSRARALAERGCTLSSDEFSCWLAGNFHLGGFGGAAQSAYAAHGWFDRPTPNCEGGGDFLPLLCLYDATALHRPLRFGTRFVVDVTSVQGTTVVQPGGRCEFVVPTIAPAGSSGVNVYVTCGGTLLTAFQDVDVTPTTFEDRLTSFGGSGRDVMFRDPRLMVDVEHRSFEFEDDQRGMRGRFRIEGRIANGRGERLDAETVPGAQNPIVIVRRGLIDVQMYMFRATRAHAIQERSAWEEQVRQAVSVPQLVGALLALELLMEREAFQGTWPQRRAGWLRDVAAARTEQDVARYLVELADATRIELLDDMSPGQRRRLMTQLRAVGSGGAHTVGEAVEVLVRPDTWYSATIMAVLPDGNYRVHYTGWNDTWDENVGTDRIR